MNQIKKLFFTASVILAVLPGCKKFVDVNQDLNNNTIPKSDLIMTGAMSTTYRNQVSTNQHAVPEHWTGVLSFSNGITGGGEEKTYNFTNATFNVFTPIFNNLADYDYVMKNAARDGVSFWKDPANVMSCYAYQELVDFYGDVPYTDAFKGTTGVTPKYDNQQTIYEDLVNRLDSAMDRMQRTTWPTSLDFTQQDIYFQLNKTKWIQFANTLKLRILMRQSYMPGRDAYIQAKATTRLANGFLAENVLCQPGYQFVTGKLNPFYSTYGFNEINSATQAYDFRKMNTVIISFLKAPGGGADTFRLQSLAYPAGTSATYSTPTGALISITAGTATPSQYSGTQLGIQATAAAMSPVGPIQIQVPQGTRAGMLMLAAESYFLQAEFVQRYGLQLTTGVTAQTLYQNGILAHFRTCAAPSTAGNVANAGDAFAVRYYNRPFNNVNYTASTNKVQAILIQKWVSLVHINGEELWSDYRKSNKESIPPSLVNLVHSSVVTDPREPVRYLYPQSELDNNGANVPQNIDRFDSRLFWDVN